MSIYNVTIEDVPSETEITSIEEWMEKNPGVDPGPGYDPCYVELLRYPESIDAVGAEVITGEINEDEIEPPIRVECFP